MGITEAWLKENHKKLRAKKLIQSDRDGLNARKEYDIGTYPLISLKEAREENRRLSKKLEQGHDPKVVRQTPLVPFHQAFRHFH